MYDAAPRADVGSGALAGALMALFAFIFAPSIDNFDFNVLFGALGVILPFFAGYMSKKLKSVYTALVGLLALVIVAGIEFALTGTLTEATKSMGVPLLTALFITYIAHADHPDDSSVAVEDEPFGSRRRR